MLLIRLSGHSGAGKSRIVPALAKKVGFRRPIIYTSRPPRTGEVHGRDYYFMSRGFIQSLPQDKFLVGDVRQSVQAVDLAQLEFDLRSGHPVIIEIFHTRWPPLKQRMQQLFGKDLTTVSVFLTAVPSEEVRRMPRDLAESYIRTEVRRILKARGKDSPDEVERRAETAVTEILDAVALPPVYDKVIDSAPEGPDGADEWTSQPTPQGKAAEAAEEFLAFIQGCQPRR